LKSEERCHEQNQRNPAQLATGPDRRGRPKRRYIHESYLALAAAEKIASQAGSHYLNERAKRGSREQLLRVLAKAPDVEPEQQDAL